MNIAACYAVLGVQPGASAATLRKAYKDKVLEHHPDRGGQPAQFNTVTESYEFLLGHRQTGLTHPPVKRSTTKCAAVVRGLLITARGVVSIDESSVLLGKDEVLLRASRDEAFLCCCTGGAGSAQVVVVGSSLGVIYAMSPCGGSGGADVQQMEMGDRPVLDVCMHAGSRLIVACVNHRIVLASLDSGSACFLADGGMQVEIVCGFSEGLVVIGGIGEQAGEVFCVPFDANAAEQLLFWSEEEEVHDLDIAWRTTHDCCVTAIAVDARNSRLAVASRSRCTVHATSDGCVLLSLTLSGRIMSLCFSPDSVWLAVAGSNEQVHVFRAEDGLRRAAMARDDLNRLCCLDTATIVSVAFVDCDTLCSGGYDKAVTRWELEKLFLSENYIHS